MLFRYYLFLLKGGALYLNKREHKLRMFCAKWLNWPSGSVEEDKNVKILQTDERATGDQKTSLKISSQTS